MRRRRSTAVAAAVSLAAAATGCGFGPGESTSGEVTLTVTRDYGANVLLETGEEDPAESETVIRLLDRETEITTRYGGGFVQSIDGLAGGQRAGRPVDWLLFVDGTLSERGAGDVRVSDGARIWWDHHDWGSGPGSGSAVVGSFPAPFARAATTDLACVPAGTRACSGAKDALARAGARVKDVGVGALGAGEEPGVLVGTYAAIRSSARVLEEGPEASGVYARPTRGGAGLALLDERARRVRTLGAGAGLVAATRTAGRPPVWAVTGPDDAGVLAAAGALDERDLAGRFAVAVQDGQAVALPVEAAR
jgi:hypothetical protein